MKLTKMNTQLNEKDAIQDMLESEKQLMSFYTTALFEGSSKSCLFCTSASPRDRTRSRMPSAA